MRLSGHLGMRNGFHRLWGLPLTLYLTVHSIAYHLLQRGRPTFYLFEGDKRVSGFGYQRRYKPAFGVTH